jgi:predicted ATPase/class 3 adenylate cyclase
MRCANCGSENPSDRKFCGECGAQFVLRCPQCGTENVPPFRFCGECGATLDSAASKKVAEAPPATTPASGERRHLTVLFCDLVGSTELAARLDPEEWREMVAAYHRVAAEAITSYGGHVAKYLGDGVMAFFGYPEAHDNDAERAARAGLQMLDAISKLNQRSGTGFSLSSPVKLAARVGIDSGAVVVGAGASRETDVFGEAPNIAARVQAAAEPGTVLITDAVHRLVSGLFVVENRGASALKGVERPLELYRIVQPSGVRGRLEAAAAVRGLTPFVGREEELRLLQNRWARALEGEGQLVLVTGEPGIGKSRLLQRFHELIPDRPHAWIEGAAAPFFQNTPFHAIVELLGQLAGQAPLPVGEVGQPFQAVSLTGWKAGPTKASTAGDADPQLETSEHLAQLEPALVHAGLKLNEAMPLIALLLNLPVAAMYPPSSIPAEQQRRRLLAMLIDWVLGAARIQPLSIMIEDLHWADASTLEVVQLLAEQGATAPLLLLCTARPEFRPPWPLRAHHTQITLNRLSTRNVREMIAQVAARNALAGETLDTVIERTGGVPLFVEELTLAVLETGSGSPAGREIPVTLHDSLMARLDRLGPAKEVIQIGAVIGSEFSYELLHAVHPVGAEELQTALRSATDAELVYVRGIAPDATYQFKHALIRDAAYEALLKSRRKELHGRVASKIDEKFPMLKEAHPEVVARHWTEAGETAQAIAEWTRAGKAAESRNAFKEAQQSYEQALALLSLLPDSAERDLHELELRQSVIRMLWITVGIRSPQSVEACARAVALAQKSGNLSQLISLMYATGAAAYVAGDYGSAATLADQALELAEREGDPTNLGPAYQLQVSVRFARGDLAGTEQHFARGLKFFEDAAIWRLAVFRLEAFGVASLNAWALGRPDLARERQALMMREAKRDDPAEVAWSGCLGALSHLILRESERAETLAAQALELSEKHQMALFAEQARCCLGLARAWLGRPSEGVELSLQGRAGLAALGNYVDAYALFLAESQGLSGAIGDALETIKQVLQPNRPDVNMVVQSEAFRLRGELQTKQGQHEAAEADFRKALALARSMGAKSLELRAATSLARLLRGSARRDEARTMLAEIYGWFTEGFDTRDLQEAKQLLNELDQEF